MNQVDTSMEQEIVKEENITPQENETAKNPPKLNVQPKKILERLKIIALHLKRPKLITIIILFSTLVVIAIALNLLSKKNQEEILSPPAIQTNSPSPQASGDISTQNITQRVKTYNSKLESLDNYQQKLQRPIVDLDISFK